MTRAIRLWPLLTGTQRYEKVVSTRNRGHGHYIEAPILAYLIETPNGRVLFFNALERSQDCQNTSQLPRDIYVVGLDESGKPTGPSAPLRGISKTGTIEIDGSLSFDQCWLYYSGESKAGQRLFRARRVR